MELPDDFEKRVFEIFDNSEISEPLIMVYTYLQFLCSKEIDSMRMSQSGISYMYNGEDVLNLPDSNSGRFLDIKKKSFVMVFERDGLVKKIFRLYSVDDDLVVESIDDKLVIQ